MSGEFLPPTSEERIRYLETAIHEFQLLTERLRKELDTALQALKMEESRALRIVDERDEMEARVVAIARQLGVEAEWSSNTDVGHEAVEAAAALVAERNAAIEEARRWKALVGRMRHALEGAEYALFHANCPLDSVNEVLANTDGAQAQREVEDLRQLVEQLRGELAKSFNENLELRNGGEVGRLRARIAEMVERVRSVECVCPALDFDAACQETDRDVDFNDAGEVINHDPRCPKALAAALEEIAGGKAEEGPPTTSGEPEVVPEHGDSCGCDECWDRFERKLQGDLKNER